MHELDLDHFQYGGVRITGFSIIDYSNINTIVKTSEILGTEQSLNKLPFLSVIIISSIDNFLK